MEYYQLLAHSAGVSPVVNLDTHWIDTPLMVKMPGSMGWAGLGWPVGIRVIHIKFHATSAERIPSEKTGPVRPGQ